MSEKTTALGVPMTQRRREELGLVARYMDMSMSGAIRFVIKKMAQCITDEALDLDTEWFSEIELTEPYARLLGAVFGERDWFVERSKRMYHAVDAILQDLQVTQPVVASVLRMRYGIGQDKAMTLEAVGASYGVSRERIRQLEAKGLQALRHPFRSRKMKQYIDDGVGLTLAEANVLKEKNETLQLEIETLKAEMAYLKRQKELLKRLSEVRQKLPVFPSSTWKMAILPIEKLGFSIRVYNALKRTEINTVSDLIEKIGDDPENLLTIRNFGEGSLKEVKEKLGITMRYSEEERG